MPTVPKDGATRYQGVYARHKQACAVEHGRACDCKPSYWGKVWDRAAGRHRKTRMLPTVAAAKAARLELADTLRRGALPASDSMRVKPTIEAFLKSIESGVALNKHGRPYKPSTVRDLRGALEGQVVPALGAKRLADVRRRDVQALVDELSVSLSGSRVRTVVNAIHSLYTWAHDRELVDHDPAGRVRLPALEAAPRDRVAGVTEMQRLLDTLDLTDALPYALAVYAGARRTEIRHARVSDIDLDLGVLYLGTDERGRKSRAALRAVPVIKPLGALVRRSLIARGRPAAGELLCPPRKPGAGITGMLSFEALQVRADKRWKDAKLTRITAHECRHTFLTWLDAAGVRQRVVSEIAGHEMRTEGARVTQRYTHTLPDDLANAQAKLEAFLTSETQKATG